MKLQILLNYTTNMTSADFDFQCLEISLLTTFLYMPFNKSAENYMYLFPSTLERLFLFNGCFLPLLIKYIFLLQLLDSDMNLITFKKRKLIFMLYMMSIDIIIMEFLFRHKLVFQHYPAEIPKILYIT